MLSELVALNILENFHAGRPLEFHIERISREAAGAKGSDFFLQFLVGVD